VRLVGGIVESSNDACMLDQSDDEAESRGFPEMDFRAASFPSDALSVKRFRTMFPTHFDGHGLIVDGFTNNDFFFPQGPEDPPHLLKLTQLVCDERVVAAGAFYATLGNKELELTDEERESIARSKARLEKNLEFFKLADSLETARLLIRQIEEQGEQQGRAAKSIGR
jgi:hypothetical protein